MRISVFGAGAIGGWLAAGCVRAGADTTVLARGATHDALAQNGLLLDEGDGPQAHPVTVTKDPADLRGADLLILGLKAHDLPGVAPMIEAALGPDTQVMPAINGLPWWYFANLPGPAAGLRLETVDPGGVLSRVIPADRIVGSVVYVASYAAAPGHIRVVRANKLWLGDAAHGQNANRVAAFLAKGGIPAEATDKLHWHVWNKLWGNSNLNPLSALTRADVAQMLSDPDLRDTILAMMREMAELGDRLGLDPFEAPEARMKASEQIGAFRTSMLQDVEAGRTIEIDPILGSLVELARHLDHPVPTMAAVYGMARLLDRNLRSA